jgi:DNA-directed RNA polymerase specialized sigma24 family protein
MSLRVISTAEFFVSPYVWTLTDEALLAGFAVGDARAAETFIARFQRRVYGVALAITRDTRLAEDLAQEAFTRAWRHAETFDPGAGAWRPG